MAYYEIAFDLGSKNTRAGIAGTDIFYNEPTVVAYSAKGNKYLGAGYAALKAYEKDKQKDKTYAGPGACAYSSS